MFKPVTPNIKFPEMEKKILDHWYKDGIVEKYLHRNDSSKQIFSFLDGPITANNPMGIHHAWGRTYKDLWQRYYSMKGYRERFQNGFDCQGLWVEVEVEKELGIRNKKDIENLVPGNKKESIAKFVNLCKERVLKFSSIQTEQSKRLGYFMDWDHSYFTMSDENNYMIWYFLKTCFNRGWIYKGHDSVPWCPRCETAISQHEMLTEDYKELTHETVFVKLPINTPGWENTYLLIWTTTPWTVPANVAVGVNVKLKYKIWEKTGSDEKIIIADRDESGNQITRDFKGKTISICEYIFGTDPVKNGEIKSGRDDISGKDLVGLKYSAPFDDLERVKKAQEENSNTFHTVVDASDIVMAAEGTGLLHVAPGAGKEDFDLGKKENLPVISVIADDASYLDGLGDFSGKNAKKHPELIIDFLKTHENGRYLLKTLRYTHRYPACWRCKAELVWKVADEWYIAMDKKDENGKTLRERMVGVAKKIHWIPEFGLERELDWLKNMHDWLISKKNRYWGLALPIYECKTCGTFEVIGSKAELKEKSISGWGEFEGHSPHKPWVDDVAIKCGKCNGKVFRIDDVGNPWLDAGIVPFSTLTDPSTGKVSYTDDKKYWKDWFPADFITESFPGQFKNWFYSLIAMSAVLENSNSYKTVLGFATLLGEDGRPMHKSWGNALEFNESADKIGVDVMRWMYVTHNPEQNILFGYKTADETRRKFHILLWNVYNFFITYAVIDRWIAVSDKHESKPVNILDKWILSRLNNVIKTVDLSLVKYDALTASLSIEKFVSDLSQWYVRRSRDRIGPSLDNCPDKIACHRTLYKVLVILAKILGPFTPYLSEELYTNLTGEESVHLSSWPLLDESLTDDKIEEKMTLTRLIVEQGHSVRKTDGIKVRQPLNKITIALDDPTKILPEEYEDLIKDELNVKNIKWESLKPSSDKAVDASSSAAGIGIIFDKTISKSLKAEGEARELIRNIQIKRKEAGCGLTDKINVMVPAWPEEFTEYIRKEALVASIKKGPELTISRV